MIAHRHDHMRAREPVQKPLAALELAAIALHREISGDHHEVGRELVGLIDSGAQQPGAEQAFADVQIGHLNDPHG
jgi:hypothetical protein